MNIDLSSQQVGLLLLTTISLRNPIPSTEGQSQSDWVMGFRNRHKRRELACSREQGAETRAHTCRTDANKTGNENAAKQSSRQGNWGRVVRDMKVRARFKYRECVLLRGEGCGGIPNVFHANWVSGLIVLLSVTTIWELLKRDRYTPREPDPMISRQTKKNVLGPNPEVVAPLRVSERWIPKKKNFSSTSRCSFQQRMVFVTVSVFCAFNCRVTVALQQSCVLFYLSFAIRGATSDTIVSIPLPLPAAVWLLTTCRWWRTIKAASCQWHVLCRWKIYISKICQKCFYISRSSAKGEGYQGAGYSWAIKNLDKVQEETKSELHRLHYYNEHHSILSNRQGS